MKTVAAVYLIRSKDGFAKFDNFINSYIKYGKNVNIPFYVLVKSGSNSFLNNISKRIKESSLNITVLKTPNFGYDLTSYRRFAAKYFFDYIIFLSATTQLENSEWFSSIKKVIHMEKIGIVGNFFSFDSLKSNKIALLNVNYLFLTQQLPNTFIDMYGEIFIGARLKLFYKIGQISKRFLMTSVYRNVLKFWFAARVKLICIRYRNFPSYPNLHLRTTGFCVHREVFLEINLGIILTKKKAYALESGSKSLLNQISWLGWNIALISEIGNFNLVNLDLNPNSHLSISELLSDHRSRYLNEHQKTQSFLKESLAISLEKT